MYCANQGLPGLRYFLPGKSVSIHGFLNNNSWYPTGLDSAGVTIGQWMTNAVDDPTSLQDAVEEGTLVADYGAQPFLCPVFGSTYGSASLTFVNQPLSLLRMGPGK